MRGHRGGFWIESLLLVVAAAIYAVPVGWGLPSFDTWAFDEPLPRQVAPQWVGGGIAWPERYPPLHRYALATVFEVAARTAPEASDVVELTERLTRSGRLLSVAMALGTLVLLYLLARKLAAPAAARRAGLLAAALWLGVAPQAYYAKTMNLDAPMLFWFALSALLLVRLAERPTVATAIGFAVAASAAVHTKDAAYALYLLPLAAFASARWRRHRAERPALAALLRTARDPVLLAGVAAAALALAFVYRLWAGSDELSRHLAELRGPASVRYREYDLSLAGQAAMAWQALRHFAFCLGWPGFAAATLAALAALRDRLSGRPEAFRHERLLWLAPLSLYLFFVVPVRFHYDRFFLPAAWIACLLAAVRFAPLLAERSRRAWAIGLLLCAAIGWGTARAVAVDLSMLRDGRYRAERLADALAVDDGWRETMPRIDWRMHWTSFLRLSCEELRSARFVVARSEDLAREGPRAVRERLERPTSGFARRELRAWSAPRALLDYRGVLSNLATINPELAVYERVGDPCAAP